MRNIVLALVLVAMLVAGGVGGTLATWSDSETSFDNYIETGSVDLKVNGADDPPWGTGVPSKVDFGCMVPYKIYGPYPVDVWNASQDCMPPSHLYLHIKDVCCTNTLPKEGSGYVDPITGELKPEPELVAEYGGKVNCTEVGGVGILGDDSTLGDYIYMLIADENGTVLLQGYINDLVCVETYITDLVPCNEIRLDLYFVLMQPSEEDFGRNYIPNPGEPGYDLLEYAKWNDWPSWALMKDAIAFSMEFDLWLEDP